MFFQEMNKMMTPGVDYNLSIRKQEGQLIIAVLPRANGLKDQAGNNTIPITVTGTPEELDAEFIAVISQPLQKTAGLIFNVKNFEDQLAASSSKPKENPGAELKEKKAKYAQFYKQGEEAEKQKKYVEALSNYEQAKNYAELSVIKNVEDKITSMKAWTKQGSLFDFTEEEKKEEQAPKPISDHLLENTTPQPASETPKISALPGEDFGNGAYDKPSYEGSSHNEDDYTEYPDFPMTYPNDFNSNRNYKQIY